MWICKEEIKFFGLHFNGKGVSPTQAKVEAIKKTEVRQYLPKYQVF